MLNFSICNFLNGFCFHVASVNKRNEWNTLSCVALLIACEKFGFNLISLLKFIYSKWSIIQHGETIQHNGKIYISVKDVVRPL